MSAPATLLVNADDFGLHPDIDRGILDCIEKGRVQSISFSPQGKSLDWNKLDELKRAGVRVGLHVTMVGEPWISDGRLVPGWRDLVQQMTTGSRIRRDVSGEIERQFQFCGEKGFDPRTLAHVDSHQHVHVFGGIWQPCQRLVHQFGIPRMRVPWSPSLGAIKKSIGGLVLQSLARRRRGDVPGFLPCLGLAHAGHNTAAIFAAELQSAGKLNLELCVHPGINTPDLEQQYADWQFDWTGERNALLSQQFADQVAASGFRFA
jgi:predicted glycoside hydrolase/deacetylase ChbG (UPF0249 family)